MGQTKIKNSRKISVNGIITLHHRYLHHRYLHHRYLHHRYLHHRYLYRGYLQIAALDLMSTATPVLWLTHWDPNEPVATRPLSIRKNGTWHTYNHDLTKNVMELFTTSGEIAATYDYTPFGAVTVQGTFDQPFQWSSEVNDAELALTYYNYRHYNPQDGRWINRDPIAEQGGINLYAFVGNSPISNIDFIGYILLNLGAAALSAVVEIGFQVAIGRLEGKDWNDIEIDWVSVGSATVMGAIMPGSGLMNTGKSLVKSIASSSKRAEKVGKLTGEISRSLQGKAKLIKIEKMRIEIATLTQANKGV